MIATVAIQNLGGRRFAAGALFAVGLSLQLLAPQVDSPLWALRFVALSLGWLVAPKRQLPGIVLAGVGLLLLSMLVAVPIAHGHW